MRFNGDDLAEFAAQVGDHEGRLTHKAPSKSLYDKACKERWFKLKANFLFYYRLNDYGGVDKNEDDPDRKHTFYAQSESSVYTWINKIEHASYESLKAQQILLRIQIRKKTGIDPLEYMGTPLPQRAARTMFSPMSLEGLHVSRPSRGHASSEPPSPASYHSKKSSISPSRYSLSSKSPTLKFKIPKSPSLRQPTRQAPVPPPRKVKKHNSENGHAVVDNLAPGVGGNKASFKSHLPEGNPTVQPPNLLD
ncbi:Pleckstriny domain-containing family J member 1-like [Homarus americanus]|uniref:Pleckstriny domain-containing family J member 1-like n=1 Tax=Homarus americanus TaxID=6706 RepID=A0A8J5MTK1_HOMAM|nr:Pleckstriny domain-containing family J member 1-like [Homarus americanus]